MSTKSPRSTTNGVPAPNAATTAPSSQRRANGTFAPGNTVNPGGRPKAVRELLDLARSHVPGSLDLAVKLRDDETEDSRVRLEAAKFLTAYGLGAPPKTAVDPDDGADDAASLDGLSPDEIRQLARKALTDTEH
jgi:hypothetical protein